MSDRELRVQNYYKSKQRNAVFLLAWGTLALALGSYGWMQDTPFWNGLTYPVLIFAGIQLIQAGYLIGQTYTRKRMLAPYFQQPKARIWTTEQEYTNTSLENIRKRTILLQVLIGLGMGFMLTALFAHLSNAMIGSGMGLMLQAAISYLVDVLLLWRTRLYASELKHLATRIEQSTP